jgi:glycosyltransferase involved in cell wall biosynthesis
MTKSRGHVVIVVVNLPVERDRRVIRECLALEEAGYRVTVICPRGSAGLTRLPGSRSTDIRSFRQPLAGSGVLSFAFEFAWALIAVTARLLGLMLRTRVDAVQACNPPDVFWVLALLLRALGRPFVFDHHDLSPELYECKTDKPDPRVLAILKWFEKMSWRRATAVVSTNESYRDLAITRGGLDPDKVVVVRNGPAIAEVAYDALAPRPARHEIVYLGVINPQDHVEAAVLAAERLVGLRGNTDWKLVVAGDGECLPALRALATARNLDDVVEFRGWLEADEVDALLNTATVAIQPDPPTKMAELSTMAKTVEYVARGVPVVAVDLLETRRGCRALRADGRARRARQGPRPVAQRRRDPGRDEPGRPGAVRRPPRLGPPGQVVHPTVGPVARPDAKRLQIRFTGGGRQPTGEPA